MSRGRGVPAVEAWACLYCRSRRLRCPHLPGGRTIEDFVADNPDGATVEKIGVALGVCKQIVDRIEERALLKLRAYVACDMMEDAVTEEEVLRLSRLAMEAVDELERVRHVARLWGRTGDKRRKKRPGNG